MLRTDLFKTVDRAQTRFIAVRDTITRPENIEGLDAQRMDIIHCKQGRLGVGYHFLVLPDGTTQLCRDVNTCGSHSRGYDDVSVAIGVVGGADEEGKRTFTRTPEQQQTVAELIKFLQAIYPDAEVSDDPQGN